MKPELYRVAGVTLWKQIRDELEYEILSGIYGPGDRLPTESDLGARFSVNRHTIRQALTALKASGLVTSRQGQGVFVRSDVIDYAIGNRTRWSENIRGQGYEPTGRFLRSSVIAAAGPVAEALELPPDAKVVRIEALREANGRPLTLTYHHFSELAFSGLDAVYREKRSITDALRSFGVSDFIRRSTWISTRLPRASEADVLLQPVNRPVLVTATLNVDERNRPIEYGVSVFAGDQVRLFVGGDDP